jgi:predicted MPP superfamily phosphohydrolase
VKRSAILATLLGGPLLLGLWAFVWEPGSLEVNRYELVLPLWPAEQDGLRIALLSDLHVGSPGNSVSKLREVVARVHRARPDVVLLAGDYVVSGVRGATFIPPETTARILAKLEAPLGVFAVLGNHDHWYGADKVRSAFESAGIRVLENEVLPLRRQGFDFWLIGIGDLWESRPDVGRILEDLPEGVASIAFTHNPDVFPQIPSRVDLTLAGHTHGGQVDLPFWGTPVVPSRFGDRYVRGHVVEKGRHLFVTSGLGTSLLPVRFRVRPEIAILRVGSVKSSLSPRELASAGARKPARPARSSPG